MIWQLDPTAPLFVGSAVVSLALIRFLVRRWQAPGAKAMTVIAGAVALWSLGYALELARSDLPGVLFFARLEYLAIVTIPTAWLLFALGFSHRQLPRSWVALLLIPPIATFLGVWSNELHGVFWSDTALGPGGRLQVRYGWLFYLHTLYSYALLVVGTLILLRWTRRTGSRANDQTGALLIGAAFPFAANALRVSGVASDIDPTPIGFAIGAVVIAWGMLRHQLFDLVPVARNLVVDSLADAVLVIGDDGRVLDANPAASELIGTPIEAILGRPIDRIFGARSSLLERFPDERRPYRETLSLTGRMLELDFTPLAPAAGVKGRLVVARDVTERVLVEIELRRAKDAAEAANRLKSQFLATMSHELRTPLTAVIGFADMLASETFGELNEPQQEYVHEILKAGRNLHGMINDVLDYAHLEAEALELRPTRFDPGELIRSVAETITPVAERRGLDFTVQLDLDGRRLLSDAPKLKRVLHHLMLNAVKFTETGGVTVTARGEPDTLRVEVRDTGIGIPESHRKQIFEPFTQVDPSDTRRYGGSGLGLAICRRYSELLRGRLELSSAPGTGSTFILTLPWQPELAPDGARPGYDDAVTP